MSTLPAMNEKVATIFTINCATVSGSLRHQAPKRKERIPAMMNQPLLAVSPPINSKAPFKRHIQPRIRINVVATMEGLLIQKTPASMLSSPERIIHQRGAGEPPLKDAASEKTPSNNI